MPRRLSRRPVRRRAGSWSIRVGAAMRPDFATLSEPANCREYVAIHHRLGIGQGDRVLDVACGSGLAIELARARGAQCAGIDASQRLVAVARDRNPEADIQVGDMHALPWQDASFDVATSFRVDVPFAWEFADPRGLRTGARIHRPGLRSDPERGGGGLPRGCVPAGSRAGARGTATASPDSRRRLSRTKNRARTEGADMSGIGFLDTPETTDEIKVFFDEDVAARGYVMNLSRLWAYQPGTHHALFDLMQAAMAGHGLDVRRRGILVAACESTLGDAYCSLAWEGKLAAASDAETASGVIRGVDDRLSPREAAMADWARKVARDPNGTSRSDVQALREVGFTDAEIFAITVFVALRLAFSTVNDALGVTPDAELRSTAPEAVLDAVTFGRPID